MNTRHDDQVRDEEADESVATESSDMSPNDRIDLADEGLHEAVEPANLEINHFGETSSRKVGYFNGLFRIILVTYEKLSGS